MTITSFKLLNSKTKKHFPNVFVRFFVKTLANRGFIFQHQQNKTFLSTFFSYILEIRVIDYLKIFHLFNGINVLSTNSIYSNKM